MLGVRKLPLPTKLAKSANYLGGRFGYYLYFFLGSEVGKGRKEASEGGRSFSENGRRGYPRRQGVQAPRGCL